MKSDPGIVLAVFLTGTVSLFLGILTARMFPDGDSKSLADLMIASVGALVGTSAGAYIALRGESQRRAKEAEDRNIVAANLAIFQLGRIYNFLMQYQSVVVDPNRADRLRWLKMARSKLQAPAIDIDFGSLAFLFGSSDPNVVSEAAIEIERFVGIVTAIGSISRVLTTEAHPRMEERGILDSSTPEEIEGACGIRIVTDIRTHTDSLVEHVDLNVPSVFATAMKIHRATRTMYPHRRVVSLANPLAAPPL